MSVSKLQYQVPPEIIFHVCGFLTPSEARKLGLTCKSLNDVVSNIFKKLSYSSNEPVRELIKKKLSLFSVSELKALKVVPKEYRGSLEELTIESLFFLNSNFEKQLIKEDDVLSFFTFQSFYLACQKTIKWNLNPTLETLIKSSMFQKVPKEALPLFPSLLKLVSLSIYEGNHYAAIALLQDDRLKSIDPHYSFILFNLTAKYGSYQIVEELLKTQPTEDFNESQWYEIAKNALLHLPPASLKLIMMHPNFRISENSFKALALASIHKHPAFLEDLCISYFFRHLSVSSKEAIYIKARLAGNEQAIKLIQEDNDFKNFSKSTKFFSAGMEYLLEGIGNLCLGFSQKP